MFCQCCGACKLLLAEGTVVALGVAYVNSSCLGGDTVEFQLAVICLVRCSYKILRVLVILKTATHGGIAVLTRGAVPWPAQESTHLWPASSRG